MSKDQHIELEQRIDAYLKGQLSEEEADQLWADLLEFPEYYQHLKTELALKRHFEQQNSGHDNHSSPPPITDLPSANGAGSPQDGNSNPPMGSSSSRPAGNSWKWTMAAAAVVIIILGLNFFLPDQTQTAQQMALADIKVNDMETPDVLRSGGSAQDSQVAALISMGLNSALTGDQKQAEQHFNRALQELKSPKQAMDSLSLASAHLNLGIIYYNHGQYDKAAIAFDQAINYAQPSKRIREKSYWYLGNTLLNQEKLEQARDAIHNTYAMNGVYREPSYRLLRKLDYELGYVDYDNYEEQTQELE
jgi:tetratricopeptide (TPR) repeat protein